MNLRLNENLPDIPPSYKEELYKLKEEIKEKLKILTIEKLSIKTGISYDIFEYLDIEDNDIPNILNYINGNTIENKQNNLITALKEIKDFVHVPTDNDEKIEFTIQDFDDDTQKLFITLGFKNETPDTIAINTFMEIVNGQNKEEKLKNLKEILTKITPYIKIE